MKTRRRTTRIIHEGNYMAEVEVDLIDSDEGWSAYLSLHDAYKIADVRKASQEGNVDSAATHGEVYSLTPV